LEHPNIVPVYDLGLDDQGLPLLAMKLVRGLRGSDVLEEDREKMAFRDFLRKHLAVLIDVSQAVAFAHSRGIIHRDIKPSQVMLGEFGEALLMDWGLALIHDYDLVRRVSPSVANIEYTPTGRNASSPAGTPAYMAPEQTKNDASGVGTWTDIFLLGGTLYYILTGTTPNKGEDSTEAFDFAAKESIEPPEIRIRNHEIPRELSQLAIRCLRRDPKDRSLTAVEFLNALKEYQTGSSKRSEAQLLLEQAAELGNRLSSENYEELEECTTLLDRALTLWPENEQGLKLRQRILVQYCQAALNNRDLRLARLQAERLDFGPQRDQLLLEIKTREMEQQTTSRRLADADAQLKISLEHAESARQQAENLVSFMLQDVYTNLQLLHREELLDEIGQRTLRYFKQNPDKEQDSETLHNRALTLQNIGHVFRKRGKIDRALKAYQEAHQIYQGLFRRDADNNRWRLALSDHQIHLATLHRLQARYDEALRCVRIALDIRNRLAAQVPNDTLYLVAVAKAYILEGEILLDYAQPSAGLQSFSKARSIGELLHSDKSTLEELHVLTDSLFGESTVHFMNQDYRRSESLCDEANKIIIGILVKNDKHLDTILRYAVGMEKKGELLEAKFSYPKAVIAYNKASELLERLLKNDPTNPLFQKMLAFTLGKTARSLHATGEIAQSHETYERATAFERQYSAHTVLHPDDFLSLTRLYIDLAELNLDTVEPREAGRALERAEHFFQQIEQQPHENKLITLLKARIQLLKGRMMQIKGETNARVTILGEVVSQLEPYVELESQPGLYSSLLLQALFYSNQFGRSKELLQKLETSGYREFLFLRFCRIHQMNTPKPTNEHKS
ncbi:MAG: serine/threonine-protein kinase, partial [Candidatus Sumerlaeia bacterium]|nr:serine/threonine-protein kinase [Candidatus Sumerlaeia bacterium]